MPVHHRRRAAQRWKLLAFAAFVVIVGGGAVKAACTCMVPVFGSGNSAGAAAANVLLSMTGNDSTCAYHATPVAPGAASACLTFDRADAVAAAGGGGSVAVAPGNYAVTAPSEGATYIDDHGANAVSFLCQQGAAADSVTFAAPVFAFHPGSQHVTFQGSCFHFHVPYFGYGGSVNLAHDITLDGVHMDSFNCAGCANVTIKNSQVGPFLACYAAGDEYGAPSYAYCNPAASPAEAYWASVGGTNVVQLEPYVHAGGAGVALNFHLLNSHITGISSRWAATHVGGIQTWDTNGMQLIGNTFDHNAIYNFNIGGNSEDNNLTITGNTLYCPVYSQDPTEPNPGGCLPTGYRDGIGRQIALGVNTNVLVQDNTWVAPAGGLSMNTTGGSAYVNAYVTNNVLGMGPDCAGTGVVYSGNTRPDNSPVC